MKSIPKLDYWVAASPPTGKAGSLVAAWLLLLSLIAAPLLAYWAYWYVYDHAMLFKEYPVLSKVGSWGLAIKLMAAFAYGVAWLFALHFVATSAPRTGPCPISTF